FARLRRIAHVDGHEDVIGEAVEQRRDIGPSPAGIPDAVHAAALDRHEADLSRRLRLADVVDRESRRPVARRSLLLRGADHLAELAFVIGALVGELDRGEHVLGVDHQEQLVMRLQVDGPGVRWCRNIVHRARMFRIAHVENAEALGEHVADIGVAAMHHDLHTVGPAALIAVRDEPHIACMVGLGKIAHRYSSRKFGTAIQSIMARGSCKSACMARSSSVCKFTPICVPSRRLCLTMVAPIGWQTRLYSASAASMSSWSRSASASACASQPALDTPNPICGRALEAASPMSATRPSVMRGAMKS